MPISEYYRALRQKVGAELLIIPAVAAVIRNAEDEILLIRKVGEQLWGLPAGAIEPGETPSRALRREVFEETGLMVTPERVAGVFGGEQYSYEYSNGDKVEYSVVVFDCSIVKGTLRSRDGEADKLKYFKEEELPELTIPYPVDILRKDATAGRALFE